MGGLSDKESNVLEVIQTEQLSIEILSGIGQPLNGQHGSRTNFLDIVGSGAAVPILVVEGFLQLTKPNFAGRSLRLYCLGKSTLRRTSPLKDFGAVQKHSDLPICAESSQVRLAVFRH